MSCMYVCNGLCLFCNYVHHCAYRILVFLFVLSVFSIKINNHRYRISVGTGTGVALLN